MQQTKQAMPKSLSLRALKYDNKRFFQIYKLSGNLYSENPVEYNYF